MNEDGTNAEKARIDDEQRPRVVAGFARSGTTWVQDVLAVSNRLRPVFEPLHPRHIEQADKFAHRYYGTDDDDPQLRAFLRRVFFGDCSSIWTDYRIVVRKLIPWKADRKPGDELGQLLRTYMRARDNLSRYRPLRKHPERIVKFIRANMMLSWIRVQFSARIVFIIRHPAAVVTSQLRASNAWNPYANLARYRQDEGIQKAITTQLRERLFGDPDRVEAYALAWCIENSIALEQCRTAGIPVVYYEELVRSGQTEWRRILDALELTVEPGTDLVAKPSQQAWGERAESEKLVRDFASWAKKPDQEALQKIQRMLDAAEIDDYSVSEVLPVRAGSS